MTPLGPPMVFFLGPNGTNYSCWMCPTQIQPRSTDIQPFGATRAAYGKKYLIYDIFWSFPTPPRTPMAISVGPNGPNRPSWMYPTQIQPRSTEIQPFGATGATYGHKWAFYGIFGPFLTPFEAPGDNFSWSKWPKQTILDVSQPDPTKIY